MERIAAGRDRRWFGTRRRWRTWWRTVTTRRSLATLPPELLRDVGITEAEARRELDRPFWR
jgi:uncharacterized protein YjiS (DUF1127 family)